MSKDGVMVHEQIEIEGMDDEHENEKRKTKMHLQKAKKHSLEIPFVLSFTVSLKVPNHLKLTFQLLRSYFGVWSCSSSFALRGSVLNMPHNLAFPSILLKFRTSVDVVVARTVPTVVAGHQGAPRSIVLHQLG